MIKVSRKEEKRFNDFDAFILVYIQKTIDIKLILFVQKFDQNLG